MSTIFNLTITMGEAMQTPDDVADALRDTAARIENLGATEGFIHDLNGNTVGSYEEITLATKVAAK